MKKFSLFVVLFLLISLYAKWFFLNSIIGGDWPYYFDEALKEFPLFVNSWNTWQGNGLGGTNPAYFIQTYQNFTIFISNTFHIPWVITYKILWFGLFIILGGLASLYFSKYILKKLPSWVTYISITIFLTNSYVLLLADGGQLGILLAYSITPLVLRVFFQLVDIVFSLGKKSLIQSSLVAGVVLSIQVMFDPRIAYLSLLITFFYFIFQGFIHKKSIMSIFISGIYVFIFPLIVTVLTHADWMLPGFFLKQNYSNELGNSYAGIGIVKFLSFASFSQTISLLHPNWPENLFGKVYFMRWEFLTIPIISFISFYFLDKKKEKSNEILHIKIVFLGIIALLGAFLAKGATEPFKFIYIWLFQNIPGFVFFRDPTKFYLFVIISYSVLIPYSIIQVINFFDKRLRRKFHVALSVASFVLFITLWSITIRQAFLNQLHGTFSYHALPDEYIKLKDFLYNQPEFFRTFWIPRQNRFTFYSDMHPSVEAIPLLHAKNSRDAVKTLKKSSTQNYLSRLSIKYVIIPYDSLGEQFQKDRKYNPEEYKLLVKELENISWLHKISVFKKIAVFQVKKLQNHFYSEDGSMLNVKMITPYHYLVKIKNKQSDTIVFSERYSPYWIMKGDQVINSQKTKDNLNSFVISHPGDYAFNVYFSGQKYYEIGRIISIGSILVIIIFLVRIKTKNSSLHKE